MIDKLVFGIILIFTLNLYGLECEQPVKYLTEGTATPCTGYLFSPKQEVKVRLMSDTYGLLEEQNKKQIEMIDLLNKRVKLNNDQVYKLSQRLSEEKDSNFTENLVYFGLGAVITTIIAYGAVQATR